MTATALSWLDPVARQLLLQAEARQTEETGRLRQISVGATERLAHEGPLQSFDARLEAEIVRRLERGVGLPRCHLRRQILDGNHVATEGPRAQDLVLELADVAGPAV